MQKYAGKIIEEIIDWAVPVACAGALLLWKDIPGEVQHYWPVVCVFIVGVYSLIVAIQNRREVRRLRQIHEKADAKEADRKAVDDSVAKAFRAMLDDNMGALYASCVEKGYTTEDERRRYDRLHSAYEGVGGNGEAKRRKLHFEAIIDEETWKAQHSPRNE
ncbi:MAG: hypothetical protein IKK75_08220 [Clostridia bacterium]|nr:hypothetical protein [Clostridia bacterium]